MALPPERSSTNQEAAEALGEYISKLDMKGGFVTVFIILTVTLLMSDVTSNTATAAVAMPLVISITQGCGLNPIPYVYVASVGVNLSVYAADIYQSHTGWIWIVAEVYVQRGVEDYQC